MCPTLFFCLCNERQSIRSNPYKSDVFSLGMVVLEAGLLQSVQQVYDQVKQDIDEELVVDLVGDFIERYENCQILQEMVMIMLEFRQEMRMSPKRLLSQIRKMKRAAESMETAGKATTHQASIVDEQRLAAGEKSPRVDRNGEEGGGNLGGTSLIRRMQSRTGETNKQKEDPEIGTAVHEIAIQAEVAVAYRATSAEINSRNEEQAPVMNSAERKVEENTIAIRTAQQLEVELHTTEHVIQGVQENEVVEKVVQSFSKPRTMNRRVLTVKSQHPQTISPRRVRLASKEISPSPKIYMKQASPRVEVRGPSPIKGRVFGGSRSPIRYRKVNGRYIKVNDSTQGMVSATPVQVEAQPEKERLVSNFNPGAQTHKVRSIQANSANLYRPGQSPSPSPRYRRRIIMNNNRSPDKGWQEKKKSAPGNVQRNYQITPPSPTIVKSELAPGLEVQYKPIEYSKRGRVEVQVSSSKGGSNGQYANGNGPSGKRFKHLKLIEDTSGYKRYQVFSKSRERVTMKWNKTGGNKSRIERRSKPTE